MTEINGVDPRPIRVIDDYSFSIENTSGFGRYTGGGFANYERVPFIVKFQSLEQSYRNPNLLKIPPSKLSQIEMHSALLLYFDW